MLVLALDTALDSCSAAISADGRTLAAQSEVMARGHQERLGPLVRELMASAGVAFPDVERIGVTVGPGSFTGLRVGLAFAKGLGFALGRPVIGIGTLQALAASAGSGRVAAVVDAKRGQLWTQVFVGREALMAPDALEPDQARARLAELAGGEEILLIGSGAAQVADVLPGARVDTRLSPDPVVLAELTSAAAAPFPTPRPLYLRAPDAKLPGGLTPP